jgi:hypothetical protein
VNPASASEIYFSGNYLSAGIRIGVVAGTVALTVSKFIEPNQPIIEPKFIGHFKPICFLKI